MSHETAPLLSSYHEEQRERTEQLLAVQQIPSVTQGNGDDNNNNNNNKNDSEGYPVDHGKIAWMQVLGGFILFANSWYVHSLYSPSCQEEQKKK
jgi:hypothetical protein